MKLTHINEKGNAKMISVNNKKSTYREAIASGKIKTNKNLLDIINANNLPKGDVFSIAKIAGILGAKNTSNLIPMCHNLLLDIIKIDFNINSKENIIEGKCIVKSNGKTGVEIEALTGISIALLTVYDMCKSVDKKMIIEDIKLIKKLGGKSGEFIRKE